MWGAVDRLTLNELISRLQQIQSKEGNLPVKYDLEEHYEIQHLVIDVDKLNKRVLVLE